MKLYIKGMNQLNKDVLLLRSVYALHRKKYTDGETPDIYVGSTSKKLWKRFSEHKSKAKLGTGSKLYDRLRETGTQDWKIHELESKVCTKDEIRKSEQYWLNFFKPDLNTLCAYKEPGYKRLKISCPKCGSVIACDAIYRHRKSKKCLRNSTITRNTCNAAPLALI